MSSCWARYRSFIRRRDAEAGQTLVEYGLLLMLIALVVIVALIFLGPIVSNMFSNTGQNLRR